MNHRIITIIFIIALLAPPASGDLIEFHGGFFFWQQGVDNEFNTIDFTDQEVGTFTTDQYQGSGVTFTNLVFIHNPSGFSDGFGLVGTNGIRMTFDTPHHAIALFYLGDVIFQLSYQGQVIATSSWFGATMPGPLKFAGVISEQPFDEVYLFKPNPPFSNNVISIDTLYWGAPIPAPGALPLLALAAFTSRRRRRR